MSVHRRIDLPDDASSDAASSLAALLDPTSVIPSLRVTSKRQALHALAKRAAAATAQPEEAIFDVLVERERLGTTGVGNGVAIPHGKLPGLDRLYGLFARLASPVDFDALDEQPVDLVFLLLVPDRAGGEHLRALARVARRLRDGTLCEKLRGAADADALHAVLTDAAGCGGAPRAQPPAAARQDSAASG